MTVPSPASTSPVLASGTAPGGVACEEPHAARRAMNASVGRRFFTLGGSGKRGRVAPRFRGAAFQPYKVLAQRQNRGGGRLPPRPAGAPPAVLFRDVAAANSEAHRAVFLTVDSERGEGDRHLDEPFLVLAA